MTRVVPASVFFVLSLIAITTYRATPLAQAGTTPAPGSCERLTGLAVPNLSITSAQLVAAGALPAPAAPAGGGGTAPGGAGGANPYADLPAFCRLMATSRPTAESEIKIEIWLPATTWNGKFRGAGNGGLGGGTGVGAGPLAAALRRGYATGGHNTGHEGDSSYAMKFPEKIKDFGYRSAHEMTAASKALMRAFYGRAAQQSYMSESGGGTIAALSAAQRYPEDYDALAVTAMSSHLTRHTFGQMWVWQATHQSEASFIQPELYPAIHQGALDACDARDGLKDGIIGDVERCRFDPVAVQCKAGATAGCLTPPQVEAVRKLYAGPRNSRTGEEIYSPLYPGSELGWAQLAGGAQPLGIPIEFFKFYVFRDPAWDYRARPINFDTDPALADRPDIQPVNAVDPDLTKYFARGGKLLLVGGWNDAAVPPKVAVNYYRQVVAKVGAKATAASMRFFMVPGMAHGGGTTGPQNFTFDALALIEQWKENNVTPDRLIVSHYQDGKEVGRRLVCQYPQIAYYRGSGNTEDPATFECRN